MRAHWVTVVSLGLGSLAMTACATAPVPDNTWTVSPLSYDNAMAGQPESYTDVTYPMGNMRADTAGGFWTESAGSWLHIDSQGDTVRRFNGDPQIAVHGFSAISPTTLVVSREGGGQPEGLYVFDTDHSSWAAISTSGTPIGDVIVVGDGRLVLVAYPDGAPPRWPGMVAEPGEYVVPYSILSMTMEGQQEVLLGPDLGLTASDVALDVSPDGAVYVSTESETYVLAADGMRTAVESHKMVHPVLAVGSSGALLSAAPRAADTPNAEWVVESGSAEARTVIEENKCPPGADLPLAVALNGRVATLPFSCSARDAVWISDTAFVMSIGSESGAVIAKVRLPSDWTSS